MSLENSLKIKLATSQFLFKYIAYTSTITFISSFSSLYVRLFRFFFTSSNREEATYETKPGELIHCLEKIYKLRAFSCQIAWLYPVQSNRSYVDFCK